MTNIFADEIFVRKFRNPLIIKRMGRSFLY